jgi:hypothetical protein
MVLPDGVGGTRSVSSVGALAGEKSTLVCAREREDDGMMDSYRLVSLPVGWLLVHLSVS